MIFAQAFELLMQGLRECFTGAALAAFVFPMCHYSTTAPSAAPTLLRSVYTGDNDADCGATVSISFASTPANGQLIVLIVNDNTGAGPTSFSGFTAVTGNTGACSVFWRIASSESNVYSYTYAGTNLGDATRFSGFVFGGTHPTSPIETTANVANSRTGSAITTTHAQVYVLNCGGSIGGTGDFQTNPSGWTAITHGSTGNIGIGITSLIQAAAGSTGTAVWNTGTYSNSKCFTIGIRSV